MRYLLILSLLLISCTDEDDYHVDPEPTTSLTIFNQYDDISIREVSLVGYEFPDLSIDYGESEIFTLDNGINGGYDNVNVNVKFYCGARNWTGSVSKNFIQNEENIITLVDCFANGQGGCTEVCFQ